MGIRGKYGRILPGLHDGYTSACLAHCQCFEPLAMGDFFIQLPDSVDAIVLGVNTV